MPTSPLTIDKIARIIFAGTIILALVWLVGILENVLLPFCLACLISYMLEPLVELNMKWMHARSRVLPAFATLIEVGALLGTIIYFILPSLSSEINQMGEMIKKAITGNNALHGSYPAVHNWIESHLSLETLDKMIENHRIEEIVNSGASVLGKSVDFVFHTLEWLITFIYVIFILIDYPRLMRGFRMLVPPKYRPIAFRLADDIKTNMNRYFRGQALIAGFATVFYCIGFSIVGIPLAIILGVLVGILYMIPYFQYITLIPVALVCFISTMESGSFWIIFGECILVYFISQCICDYILTPKIMGKALGLNPAIILLSLSIWGTLMGIIGMIIALPLTTLILGYYQEFIIDRRHTRRQAATKKPNYAPHHTSTQNL
ncbi:MAG: AI-2E family transporter [Muribaculaceae bacterium]|nr:AI-2E family transporter [Muribaculaceae bacterium]